MLFFIFKAIYFFTHPGNGKPDMFQDFCKTYLPGYHVEQFTEEQLNRKHIALVMMMPSMNRLDPIEYFSEKIADVVRQSGLEGTVHLRIFRQYFFFIIYILKQIRREV